MSAQTPRVTAGSDGMTRVVLPRSIVAKEEVRRHLTSGLTTVFLLRATRPATDTDRAAGGARVEIRYELWDEAFLAEVLDQSGRRNVLLESMEVLTSWWETNALAVFAAPAPAGAIDLVLEVLPFSAREEADAREWLSRSVMQAQSASAIAREVPQPASTGGDFFDLLIGTSIRRRAAITFRWSVPVAASR